MYLAVKAACERHQAVWSTLPAFVTAHTDFMAVVDEINATAGRQGAGTTGARVDKVARREILTGHAERVGNALEAYALGVRDAALAVRVSVTPSTFVNARDTEVAQIAARFRDETASRVAQLAD